MEGNPHRNNFDALRLLGALLVFFSHQYSLIGIVAPYAIGAHSYGNLGVLIFFSISGYLVAASWARDPDWRRFGMRRFLRIVPALAVAVPASYVLVDLLGLTGFPRNHNPIHNGSLWTIPFEVACYALVPLAAIVSKRPALPIAALIFAAYAAFGFQAGRVYMTYFGLYFAAGALLYTLPALRRFLPTCLWLTIGYALIQFNETKLGLAFIVPPLAVWIGLQSWPVVRDIGRFGDFSYGIYIYAWPVQQIVVATFGLHVAYVVAAPIGLAVTLALAVLSWHFVERPALRLKPA